MLEKTRILWVNLGRLNVEDENRKNCVRSMPNITRTRLGDGKISSLQMRGKNRDYTFMTILPYVCWQTLKNMYGAYDNGLIFKLRNVEFGLSISKK